MDKIISVKVIPKSSRQEIEEQADGVFKARLHSAPDKGRANEELIGLLAEKFAVAKSQVTIIQGLTSKNKLVKIQS